jgi:hypothetical protein
MYNVVYYDDDDHLWKAKQTRALKRKKNNNNIKNHNFITLNHIESKKSRELIAGMSYCIKSIIEESVLVLRK